MSTPETLNDPNKELVLVDRNSIEKDPGDNKLIEIDNVIDFDNLAPNSVIVLKIGGDMGHKMRMHQAFVRFAQSKNNLFNEKKLTVLFLEPEDSLEVLTEEDMDNAGWQKKEKSFIIRP